MLYSTAKHDLHRQNISYSIMNIWAFPSFYPYNYPGLTWTGTFVHFQYKGLIENGANLKVIQPLLWNPPFPFSELHPEWKMLQKRGYPEARVYDGIQVYHPRIANMRPNRFVKKTYEERYVDAIVNFFRINKIKLDPHNDVFFSQWLPDSVYVQQAARQLGVKSAIFAIGDDVVVWPHSSEAHLKAFKKLLHEADLRMANADYLMKEANMLLGEDLPYDIAYFGVDDKRFRPANAATVLQMRKKYNIPANKVVVLIVGSAIIRKGWLDLLDALMEVKKANDDFVLVGVYGGATDFDVLAEVEKRGLSAHYIDVGEVPQERMEELYSTADVFCLPSHWEGMATVVAEAMASGLPVITTDVCGHPEVVTSGENGILVPSKRPDILASELLSMIRNKDERQLLGANARYYVVNKMGNFVHNAAKIKTALEKLLK